jgi:hypothetical protein
MARNSAMGLLPALAPAAIARPLIEALRNEAVVRNPLAGELFPQITPPATARLLSERSPACRPATWKPPGATP